jgi:hypothetical protein
MVPAGRAAEPENECQTKLYPRYGLKERRVGMSDNDLEVQ